MQVVIESYLNRLLRQPSSRDLCVEKSDGAPVVFGLGRSLDVRLAMVYMPRPEKARTTTRNRAGLPLTLSATPKTVKNRTLAVVGDVDKRDDALILVRVGDAIGESQPGSVSRRSRPARSRIASGSGSKLRMDEMSSPSL